MEPDPSAAVKKRDNRGRNKDPIWELTTVLPDKTVVCSQCHNIIHRHGVSKVERVRAHFERRCQPNKKPRLDHDDSGTTDTTLPVVPAIKPSPGSKIIMFKRKYAHWLFATGHSFGDAGNEALLDALKTLRNDVVLPTKDELKNELLDLEFSASHMKVVKALSDKPCCLTVENWVDSKGNTVTSYGAVCEDVSYYLESTTSQDRSPTGELAADEVERVMAKYKKCHFYGVITATNSVLSKTSRERIQNKVQTCKFYHGCVCHALSALVQDMSSVLPWLEKFRASMTEMAGVFHDNQRLQNLMSTDLSYSITEFPDSSSVCTMLESVIDHEKKLYTIVARRDFVEASTAAEQEKLYRVRDFVLSETFIQDLVKALEILRPLQQELKHFQDGHASLSQVYPCFIGLLDAYASMEWMSKKEKALVASCITERFEAVYGEPHGVANMLDPLYLGQTLDMKKKQAAESFIVHCCMDDGLAVDVLGQLAGYNELVVDLKANDEAQWHLLQSGTVQPFDFWKKYQQFPLLQQLAWRIFALPVSITSPSLSFSSHAFYIQSRFNIKLSPEKLQKLTHVYCNAKNRVESIGSMSFLTP